MPSFMMVFDDRNKPAFNAGRTNPRPGWLLLHSYSFPESRESKFSGNPGSRELKFSGKEFDFVAAANNEANVRIYRWAAEGTQCSSVKLDVLDDDNKPRLQMTWGKVLFTYLSFLDSARGQPVFIARLDAETLSINYPDGTSKTALANPGRGVFNWGGSAG